MAGPNPHRLHSFEELRAIMGKSWLVCEWCRRFAPLAGNLKGRDTRTTTFSCSVCGGEARHVFEDPAKAGTLQFDPRQRPRHHAEAIVRLKAAAAMRTMLEERHGKVQREDLPQWKLERQKPREPEPLYTLKPFPVRTFADAAAWGLSIEADCQSCRRRPTPFEVGDNLTTTLLTETRLRCTQLIPGNALAPDRICGGRGRFRLTPVECGGRIPAAPFIGACCYREEHTAIDAAYLVVDKPPWAAQRPRGDERFACPGCGKMMKHSWSTADRRPQPRW